MNILSGTSIQLRGGNNRCISVSCTGEDDTFFATVDGRCIGEETECFNLKNRHVEPGAVNLEDIKIRYGDKVVVKAPAARDKYLGAPRIGTGTSGSNARRKCLKFTRSGIAGLNCDDWEIIPAEMPRTHIAALNIAARSPNASLINESEAIDNNIGCRVRGDFLCAGDVFFLRSVERDELLVVSDEAIDSRNKDSRKLLSTTPTDIAPRKLATWQIVVAGMPFMPSWASIYRHESRNLLLSPSHILHHIDSMIDDSSASKSRGFYPSLGRLHKEVLLEPVESLPVVVQERLLLEDLLSFFLGMEGRYFHVARAKQEETITYFSYETGTLCIDQSLAVLCQKLRPLGETFVVVRGFVAEKNSTYEYGMVRLSFVLKIKQCKYCFDDSTLS